MLPAWIISPRQKPSISLPGPSGSIYLSAAFEPPREPFGKPGGADFPDAGIIVVRHAEKGEPGAFEVRECVACRVVAVAWLAGRADDGQPLAMRVGGDRRSGYRFKRHR